MLKKIIKFSFIFILGMCTYGFIESAIIVLAGRSGTVGGEVFIIPLMIGLIYIGWCIATSYCKEKYKNLAKLSFKRGFAIGIVETLKSQYKQQKQG